MMTWYFSMSKKYMLRVFIIIWIILLTILTNRQPFIFIHIYLPYLYPILLMIFLTLYLQRPYIPFLFELQKKNKNVLLKEMFIQGFHLVLLVFIFCCIHMFIMVLYDITFKLDEVMMLHVSSLYLYGLFHPILTPVFYKIIGFILFFISHHFLLDISMYELYTFLFILPIHDHQIVIVILSFFVIQVIHYISLVKKAL